jgi:hypothetical protein
MVSFIILALPVSKHLDLTGIELGEGDRNLCRGGKYIPKYKLLLPKEIVDPEGGSFDHQGAVARRGTRRATHLEG